MSVKRRLTGYSGMRVDWPHIRSIESSISFDFDSVLRGMVTGSTKPYLIRGFEVQVPDAAISASSLQVDVADTAILHSTAGESGTIFTIPSGTAADQLNSSNSRVVGSFQNGVPNYVSVELVRVTDPDSADQTAGWSEAEKTEFQRTVPIGTVMDYRYIISTSGFSTNLPLYIIGVSANGAVEYIQNSRSNLFRLGSGGTVPDPGYSFDFGSISNGQDPLNPRREWINENPSVNPNPVTVLPGEDANAFRYGDFSITTLKGWMDAVMTRFKEITGSYYWYTDSTLLGDSINTFDLWWDAVGSVMTGSGNISYNLILEINQLGSGALQTDLNDPNILPGDSYVEGDISLNKANLTAYNNSQLVVNSLLRDDFIFNETLRNRRVWRPNLGYFTLDDLVVATASERVAVMARESTAPDTSASVSSWSYSSRVVTVNTSDPHLLEVGDYVYLSNLESNDTSILPNGVHLVKDVPNSNTFIVTTQYEPTGIPSVTPSSSATKELNTTTHPFLPKYEITEWEYVDLGASAAIYLTIPNHGFTGAETGIVVSGLTAATNAPNGRHTSFTVETDRRIKFSVSPAPTGTPGLGAEPLVRYDSYDFLLTVSGADPDYYEGANIQATAWSDTQFSYTIGADTLPALPTASGAITMDGVVAITTVANPVRVLRVNNDGSGILLVTTDEPHGLTTNPGPISYTIYGDQSISPYIRTYERVQINTVSHGISQIEKKDVGGDSWLLVTTSSTHNYQDGNSITISGHTPTTDWNGTFDIPTGGVISNTEFYVYFDNTGDTAAAEASSGTSLNLNQFEINPITHSGTIIVPPPFYYINTSGDDDTFARFPDNPYPGPIQWNSDIIVKGIVGDKYFRIPQTATATGTSLANYFNNNGLTGTAFLQDGEVAYIELDRGSVVSNGATYSTSGGDTIVGSVPPTYENGSPVQAGDFVKFESDSEAKWVRIAGTFGDPILTNTFTLVSDNGQPPSTEQRPAATGTLLYTKATYDEVTVKPHYQVAPSPDIYWLGVRRDNGSTRSKVYFRSLELEQGETREINDNAPSNHLLYTGAGTEAAVSPNYTTIDTGAYGPSEVITVGDHAEDIDVKTRAITFVNPPELGFEAEDKLTFLDGGNPVTYTINFLVSNRTVIVKEDISALSLGQDVKYLRSNYKLLDTDNLTLGMRKSDREQARINTSLERPIYDESVYIQKINLNGTGIIKSGSYIYQGGGGEASPDRLAWVLYGNNEEPEMIEGVPKPMPGTSDWSSGVPYNTGDEVVYSGQNYRSLVDGNTNNQPDTSPSEWSAVGGSILVHLYSGSYNEWVAGGLIYQNGSGTGLTVDDPGPGGFDAPSITANTEIVLPPNRRTQVKGGAIVVFPAHASYKASIEDGIAGEELLVIANDSVREANLDYEESFGGPKGMIKVLRDMPPKTRMRFRLMSSFGSTVAKLSGNVTMQLAYDGGRIVSTVAGLPVDFRAGNASAGGAALAVRGSLEINGQGASPSNIVGGIFGPRFPTNTDQAFLIGNEANKPKEVWAGLDVVKTHSGYTGSGWKRFSGSGVSTGDAATVISNTRVTILEDQVARIAVNVTARRTDGPLGVASFRIEGTFYNAGLGAVAAGSPANIQFGADGDGFAYAVGFGLAGDDVVLVVFGTVGSTVQWVTGVDYQIVESST